MKIKPISDYVMIEPIYHTKTEGGILIPKNIAEENYREGIVIAVGPGRINENNKRIPMETNVGNFVILGTSGYDIEVDGKEYYMVKEKYIRIVLLDKNKTK